MHPVQAGVRGGSEGDRRVDEAAGSGVLREVQVAFANPAGDPAMRRLWALSGKRISWGERKSEAKKKFVPYEVRKERIRQSVPVTDLLDRLGVQAGPKMKNGHPTYHCPFHDDTNPSMEVGEDNGTWTCWPCGLKMRDAITLVQMMLFPEEQSKRPSDWFDATLSRIEALFGLDDSDLGTGIRAAAELRALKDRQVVTASSNRLATRVSSRSNRFRLELAKVVRRAWGDLGGKSQIVVALYGHLEYLLVAGRTVSDSDQYNEWRDDVSTWVNSVKRRICR